MHGKLYQLSSLVDSKVKNKTGSTFYAESGLLGFSTEGNNLLKLFTVSELMDNE